MDMLQSSSDDGMITRKLALDVHLSDNENGEFYRLYLNDVKKRRESKLKSTCPWNMCRNHTSHPWMSRMSRLGSVLVCVSLSMPQL